MVQRKAPAGVTARALVRGAGGGTPHSFKLSAAISFRFVEKKGPGPLARGLQGSHRKSLRARSVTATASFASAAHSRARSGRGRRSATRTADQGLDRTANNRQQLPFLAWPGGQYPFCSHLLGGLRYP
jgi:hypothetical protein